MKIIQYLFKFYYTIFQNFSSLIKSKDDEIDYLNNKINSLNKSNDSLKKKNSKLKLEIKRLNGKVIQKHNVTSVSPKYQPFAVDKPPIKKISPRLDFNELIAGRTFKVSKIVREGRMPNPEQCCPNCNSPSEFHSLHTKNQKKCKCCDYHFNIKSFQERNRHNHHKFCCPYCEKSLDKIKQKAAFDIFKCRNKDCPYRIQSKKHSKHHRDKISYIYRHYHIEIKDILSIINDSDVQSNFNFRFRKFNFDIFTKILTFSVNHKLSNRACSQAMTDFFGVKISHTQVANYCSNAASVIATLNHHAPVRISDSLVADETYIKVKGKIHYIWIIYDYHYGSVISYHISDKRDTEACITAIVKALHKYKDRPETINFLSDAYTAYPLALQYVSAHFNIEFKHNAVAGLKAQPGEDLTTRKAKQRIERLNRTFKESYRVTTGYSSLEGARKSFELWMFYYNFLRIKVKSVINSLSFIEEAIGTKFYNVFMPAKWQLILKYTIDNLVT